MKFKLDENFGQRCFELLTAAGHDVATVAGQGMSGAADLDVLEACRKEQRCLVSLDLDFSDPIRFPPSDSSGIAVVRGAGTRQLRCLAHRGADARQSVGNTIDHWQALDCRDRSYPHSSGSQPGRFGNMSSGRRSDKNVA